MARRRKEFVCGDLGGSKEIVQLFLDHGPVRMDQIRGAMDGEDLEAPERGAHSLKSSAANVGAHHVHRVASEVELAASGGDLQGVRDLMDGNMLPRAETTSASPDATA